MDIARLLTFGVKQGASALHLSAGIEPMIRLSGEVQRIEPPPTDTKQARDTVLASHNGNFKTISNNLMTLRALIAAACGRYGRALPVRQP